MKQFDQKIEVIHQASSQICHNAFLKNQYMDLATKWLIRAACGVVIATGVFTMHADSSNKQGDQREQAQNAGW